MKKQIGYWTKENCAIAASKYLTKTDFRKENSGAYDKAWINNWLNDICSHMIDPTLTTFSEFVDKSNNIYNYMFEYNKPITFNMYDKIEIKCKKNGHLFKQTPIQHYANTGCQLCNLFKRIKFVDKPLNTKKLILIKSATIDINVINFYYNTKNDNVYVVDSLYNGYKKLLYKKNSKGLLFVVYKNINVSKTFISTITATADTRSNRFTWTNELIIKYLNNEFLNKNKQLPTYTLLKYYPKATPEKSIYSYFSDNGGGSKKYYTIIKELNGDVNEVIYRDKYDNVFKSNFEFIFACFCQHNNIEYLYEPIKIENRIPDFYIVDKNIYVEVHGYTDNRKSNIRSTIYNEKANFKMNNIYSKYAEYIIKFLKIENDPINSIKNFLILYYPNITTPDITEYYQKYCIGGKQFIEKIKDILILYNDSKITNKDLNKKGYCKYYRYIKSNYKSVKNAIIELKI